VLDAGLRPQGGDQPLEQMADPTGGERLAALDATDRPLVAGEDSETQIGTEGLAD